MIFKRRLIFETCANCGKKIEDDEQALLIDDDNDQIFCSENCLRENFEDLITKLEKEHEAKRSPDDIPLKDFPKYHHLLELVLNEPDEIWDMDRLDDEAPISFYIGEFIHDQAPVFYIAATYLIEDKAAFVYTHFPTKDPKLVQAYRQGTLIYSGLEDDEVSGDQDEAEDEDVNPLVAGENPEGDLDDELNDMDENEDEDGDEEAEESVDLELSEEEQHQLLAPIAELIEESASVRHPDDIQPEDFGDYEVFKIKTLESPDEIWKLVTEEATTILINIAYYHPDDEFVAYIVLSLEGDLDENIPVFGFPTLDHKIVDIFRRGTNVYRRQIQTV